MKLTTAMLTAVLMTGGAWAQNPNIINNVQNQVAGVQQQKTTDSNAALGDQATRGNEQSSQPKATSGSAINAPAKPATATKAASTATKPAVLAAKKQAVPAASKASNKLERVNVVRHSDDIQIEIGTREAVAPTVDKLTSPDRVVVELPATAMATEQSKIPVGSDGVQRVRIGMDGKMPPTTSVVIDLDHALAYDVTPGSSNKLVLTLHVKSATQVASKPVAPAAPAKTQSASKTQAIATAPAAGARSAANANPVAVTKQATAAKPAVNAKPAPVVAVTSKPGVAAPPVAKPATVAKAQTIAPAARPVTAPQSAKVAAVAVVPVAKPVSEPSKAANATIVASKPEPKQESKIVAAPAKSAADDKMPPIGATADAAKTPKPEEQKWAMTGKRDPFFSPIVQQAPGGSGCTTGKKCLEIGQINVRGIVKSEAGFIAVVTNSLNKAYFLHENDPVFNGYVLRITGDSVVFQESYQDKFGNPLTREVTKRVVTPAV